MSQRSRGAGETAFPRGGQLVACTAAPAFDPSRTLGRSASSAVVGRRFTLWLDADPATDAVSLSLAAPPGDKSSHKRGIF
jgi:hypothetical protein